MTGDPMFPAPLEPWPELSEFIRQLVRDEVDAQHTATTHGLAEFVRKHVRSAVDEAIAVALDGFMDEIISMVQPAAERAATPAEPAQRSVTKPGAAAMQRSLPRRTRSSDEWLTPRRAARIAGVKPSTITMWARRGDLHRYGTQRRVLVSREDLDRLIRRGNPPPQPVRVGSSVESAIVELLQGSPTPMTATQIRDTLGGSRSTVFAVVRNLVATGELVPFGERRGPRPPLWTPARARAASTRMPNGHAS